ncbi:MAG: type II toxin-antitoxin system Phd/YefM family antitoxin [Chloroflexota bacterium]
MATERPAQAVAQVVEAPGRASGETLGEVVGAFQAKTHLSRLLEEVQRGKIITITRRGVPVAVLAPPDAVRAGADEEDDDEGLAQAIAAWRRYRDARQRQGYLRATVAELLAWKEEGRR